MIARATGKSISEILNMPSEEYDAWERHMARGLAPEVWTPLLLAELCMMVMGAFGGNSKQFMSTIPWLREDTGMLTPEQVRERRTKIKEQASRKHAIEALAALRLKKD